MPRMGPPSYFICSIRWVHKSCCPNCHSSWPGHQMRHLFFRSSVVLLEFTCIGFEYCVIQIAVTWVYRVNFGFLSKKANICKACSKCPCLGDTWYWDRRETSCNMSTLVLIQLPISTFQSSPGKTDDRLVLIWVYHLVLIWMLISLVLLPLMAISIDTRPY